MNDDFSEDELIEEEFLKYASANRICAWLQENADSGVTERRDLFYRLREKYEPIWSKRKNKILRLSVCRYGRNIKNLKRLLFDKQLPAPYVLAILKNSALMRDGGIYENGNWRITCTDVVNLYHLESDEKKPFFWLFRNDGLDERFLTRLFLREGPLHAISDEDLFRVLYILFNPNRKFFSERAAKYSNEYLKSDARNLANAIVKFISRSKEKAPATYDPSFNVYIAQTIRYFIEDSMSVGSDGISDIRTLMSFKPSESLNDQTRDELEQDLSFIRFHFGDRAYKKIILTHQREAISKLMESDSSEVRSIYYRNAPLDLIYSVNHSQLEKFFEEMATESPANIYDFFMGDSRPTSNGSQKILEVISQHFKKDNAGFSVSLALNRNHYKSNEARAFLREVCSYGDFLGNTFPFPLGFGTSLDLFERTCDEIRRESPEYFDDDTSEARLIQRLDMLQVEIEQLKMLFIDRASNRSKRAE